MKTLAYLFCMVWCSLIFSSVSVQLDSKHIDRNEPFNLVITMHGVATQASPDLTPLQRDFIILSTEQSTNYSVVNGQANLFSQWSLLLRAKHVGVLTIPSLQIGQEKTNETTITVNSPGPSATALKQQRNENFKLIASVDDNNPFINQQVIYTVKLYSHARLYNVRYQPPTVQDGLLIPLGKGKHYVVSIKGKRVEVEEQQYALFPQKSARFTITPPSLVATTEEIFPRPLTLQPEPTLLQVKPVPAEYKKINWLPAKKITIQDQIDNESGSLTQGSTFVRTITIQSESLPSQLLPTIELSGNTQFSTYPQKRKEETVLSQSGVMGTLILKTTYLINKGGDIILPEYKLPWFNVQTGKEEFAVLPERKIHVDSPFSSISHPPHTKANANPVLSTSTEKQDQLLERQSPQQNAPSSHGNFFHMPLAWLVSAGFALAWVITLLFWFLQKRRIVDRNSSRSLLKRLRAACLHNDAIEAKKLLLQWAQSQWPEQPLLSLLDIQQRLVHEPLLREQINQLSQALYSEGSSHQWSGSYLWLAIAAYKPPKNNKNKGSSLDLPPLDPTRPSC